MDNGQDIHLILTGGEPLLGWQRFYIELFEHPRMQDLKNVTIETNTTQFLQQEFRDYLKDRAGFKVTFSCSPKLSVSGEAWDEAIKPTVAADYASILDADMYLKFVVADETDVDEVGQAVAAYRELGVQCPVYLMPLGGRSEGYALTEQKVAELAMQQGWRFSPRMHIGLFGNAWGT
jgi:7-carboxy-7-deazaguanine synthase